MNRTEAQEKIAAAQERAVAEIKKVPAFRLAQHADCGEPDSVESAGAALLVSVRDSTAELLDNVDFASITRMANDPSDIGWLDEDGVLHEIADDAPDVYTHTRWMEFVDLAAYNEDPFTTDGTLTEIAGVALFQIAERLVTALLTEAAETLATLLNDEDEGDDESDYKYSSYFNAGLE